MPSFGDIATWVAAVVAIVAAGVASIQARKANSSAARSASAAERSAAADERMAAIAAEQASYSPPWEIMYATGDTFQLWNRSTHTEYGVMISIPPDSHVVSRLPKEPVDVDANSFIDFLVASSYASRDAQLTVTWHRVANRSDDAQSWRAPVPRRPR